MGEHSPLPWGAGDPGLCRNSPRGAGRLAGGRSVHRCLSASSALRLVTQSEDTVAPALLQSERHFLGGVTRPHEGKGLAPGPSVIRRQPGLVGGEIPALTPGARGSGL